MAAYPFTTFHRDSTTEDLDGRIVVRASNGSVKVRVPYSADKRQYVLVHRLKSSEWSTLNTFYGSNKGTSFTLAFDGGTTTCVFVRPPQRRWMPGNLYMVNVYAAEV